MGSFPRGWMAGTALVLECPSGIAGNLFATALSKCGVPDEVFTSLPMRLGLPDEFSVVYEAGVWDGVWSADALAVVGGPVASMPRIASHAVSRRAHDVASSILERRWAFDPTVHVADETWCDTLFDACAAASGLEWLGWPEVVVVGPLPRGHGCHPLAAQILQAWEWQQEDYPVEVVTPTGAAVLAATARQAPRISGEAAIIAEISGRYCREYGLPPLVVSALAQEHA